VLVILESRRREPLIDMRYFRSVPFSGAALIGSSRWRLLAAFCFLNTLYLQDVRGYSALHAGLLTIPMAAMLGVFSTVSGRLVASRGPRPALMMSGALIGVGAVMLIGLSAHTAVWYLIVAYLIYGAGRVWSALLLPILHFRACPETRPVSRERLPPLFARPARPSGSVTGAIVASSSVGFVHASHARGRGRRLWGHRRAAGHVLDRTLGAGDCRAKRRALGHDMNRATEGPR